MAEAKAPQADLDTYEKQIKPLMDKYCVACHGPDKDKGDLRVDTLDPDLFQGLDAEHWEEVYNQLNIGDMPPDDEEQPTPEEREIITAWLSDELRAAAALARSTGGSNVIRRLTRYEYNNTLRDLLGVDMDYAKDLPPEGAAKEGFVNNSSVLGTSALHLEYFQRIASQAVRKALAPGQQPERFVLEVEPEHFVPKPVADEPGKKKKKLPQRPVDVMNCLAADSGVLLPPSTPARQGSKKASGGGALLQVNSTEIPFEGPIRITVRAAAVNPGKNSVPRLHIELGYNGGASASPFEVLASQDISDEARKDYVFDVRAENFPLITLNTKGRQFLKIRNAFNAGTLELPADQQPGLIIDSIKIEGQAYDTWPPETRSRILGESALTDEGVADAPEVIANFMTRAYRRPAGKEEVTRMVTLYETLRSREASHEGALIDTFSAVLSSPGFLMLAEPAPAGASPDEPRDLNQYELASRLSYFLWSTMPDEELMSLAQGGQLSDAEVLGSQVQRMLADDRAEAFYENFTTQWFHLDGIYAVAINPEFFPQFDDRLKDVMNAETVAFFTDLVTHNRSALDLVDSKRAMLNADLAKHYGIAGVSGDSFQSVKLEDSGHRGGVLTQASLLTLNSSGDDTHPIKRGVWVLERLLGDPPPPPPPAVPTLAEAEDNGERQSLKQKLEAHREQEACATCHKKIDPWGLAFENYDGIGVWRDSTVGEEPLITEEPASEDPAPGADFFPKQKGVDAPTLAVSPDAGDQEKALVKAVNEALTSLQRPYNHLRSLGSEGKGDQLVRFLEYIDKREPLLEGAIDKLLIETKEKRRNFNKAFREQNQEALESNADIRRISLAKAPENLPKSNGKKSPVLRGEVDPATELADGTKIQDLDALKAYILEQKRDQFSETVIRKLMGYALGRYLDFTDSETVESLNVAFAEDGYRMRDLVERIVLTETFRTK